MSRIDRFIRTDIQPYEPGRTQKFVTILEIYIVNGVDQSTRSPTDPGKPGRAKMHAEIYGDVHEGIKSLLRDDIMHDIIYIVGLTVTLLRLASETS